jgi:hypothetical protein
VSATGIDAFLQKYPTGAEAEQARAKRKDRNRYRMHLTSEPTEAKAQRRLEKLKLKRKERASDFAITPDTEGKTYSIDSPGMTQKEATRTCEPIKHEHEACQVVEQ